MIVCLYGVLRRRLQSRTGAGDSGAKAIGGSRIDQRSNTDGRLTRYEEVHHEREMAGCGEGERGGGKVKGAT